MKKFFVIMILCLMMSSTASAAQVRICDFGLDTFINRYNDLAKKYDNQYIMMKPIKAKSDSLYDYYGVPLNNQLHGNSLIILVDKEGYVSSVLLTNDLPDNALNTTNAIINILTIVGANNNEIKTALDLLETRMVVYQWINNTNRYVLIGCEDKNFNGAELSTFHFFGSDDRK